MSRGRKRSFPLPLVRLHELIAEQSGIDPDRILDILTGMMTAAQKKVEKSHSKSMKSDDDSHTDPAVELMCLQYMIRTLDALLEDVSDEDLEEARRILGVPEKKLMN